MGATRCANHYPTIQTTTHTTTTVAAAAAAAAAATAAASTTYHISGAEVGNGQQRPRAIIANLM